MSLDGKSATRNGDSRWISGSEARRYVHNLRYISDAIMAGTNTILVDNPHLTTRCSGGKGGTVRKQPLRVIVDGRGRTPPTARIFSEPGKTLLAIGRRIESEEKAAFVRVGAELLELPSTDGGVDLKKLLQILGARGITSILVEGGGVLLGSLFDCRLIDKVIAFIAPIIIGGREAKSAVGGEGVDSVTGALKLEHVSVKKLDRDLMVSGYVKG
jgi:diaminohydroxyphosphoribosylaminopyrimidine deaminase/5-amino-6-(5-phosphoribosylamino)uracil reductase